MSKKLMDDLVFGQLLCDDGYRVEAVVGTTYSLGLETFLSLPFSLGFLEEPDEAMKMSPSYLYAAMKICADKLAVFCNFSNISVPVASRKVFYALMEDCIFSINAGTKRRPIVNFHPKVWVIKETDDGGGRSRIKLIVMSRNITSDNSLDQICEMNAEIGTSVASEECQAKHQPLCDFLEYLAGYTSKDKKNMIRGLIKDIRHIRSFNLDGSPFDDYDFFPMGIKGYNGSEIRDYLSSNRELIVMSPFIDSDTLSRFIDIKDKTIVTRESSVDESILSVIPQERIYTVRPGMISNEDDVNVDLHAKMYFITDKSSYYHYLFLGSTNATKNGFERNVEFLVKLRLRVHTFSYESFKESLIDDEKFTQLISLPITDKDKNKETENTLMLRNAITSLFGAEAVMNKKGMYDIVLHSVKNFSDSYVRPLMSSLFDEKLITGDILFEDILLENVSQFFIVRTPELETLVKLDMKIPEGRDKAICRKVMNREQFIDCISFILSDSKKAYIIQKNAMSAVLGSGDNAYGVAPALYEDLLRNAYERPEVLEGIQKLVESTDKELIDDSFMEVYNGLIKSINMARR